MLIPKQLLQLIGSLLVLFILTGCGSYQLKMSNAVAEVGGGGDVQTVLDKVKAIEAGATDSVHKQLNLAMLYHLVGDYKSSISTLAAAKKESDRLDAISISENIASVTLNDTMRSFTPKSAELLLLYELQILNYLALGDLDGARVEVLQAGEQLKTFANNSSADSRLISLYYLCGLVYELNHELSDALIAYRHAYKLYTAGASIPSALSDALLLLTKSIGLHDEYDQYLAKFAPSPRRLQKLLDRHNYATWVGMYFQGMVAPLQSAMLAIYVPQLGHNITLALPTSGTTAYGSAPANIIIDGTLMNWQQLEDFQGKANIDLDRDKAKTTARMVARAVAKHQVSRQLANSAGDNAAGVSAIFDVVNLFLEVADTRNWNSAPATILISRSRIPAGKIAVSGISQAAEFNLEANQIAFYMRNQYAKQGLLFINR